MGKNQGIVIGLVGAIVLTAASLYLLIPEPEPAAGRRLGGTEGQAKAGWTKLPPRARSELPGAPGAGSAVKSGPPGSRSVKSMNPGAPIDPNAPPASAPAPSSSGTEASGEAPSVFAPVPAGIRQAMQQARPALRDCYEDWLRMQPGLGGRLVTEFIIAVPEDKNATLAEVKEVKLADTSIKHPMLEGCVLNVIGDLQFEVPDDDVSVAYPFQFSSPDAGTIDSGR